VHACDRRFRITLEAGLETNANTGRPMAALGKYALQVRSWGYDPLVVSSSTGRGVDEVMQVLRDKTSVVAGPSGVSVCQIICVRACLCVSCCLRVGVGAWLRQYVFNLPAACCNTQM